MSDVLTRFTTDDHYQVVQVECDSPSKSISEGTLVGEIVNQLGGLSLNGKSFRELGEELRLHLEQTSCHLILVCASLDQLPSAFARRLLIMARELRAWGSCYGEVQPSGIWLC